MIVKKTDKQIAEKIVSIKTYAITSLCEYWRKNRFACSLIFLLTKRGQ